MRDQPDEAWEQYFAQERAIHDLMVWWFCQGVIDVDATFNTGGWSLHGLLEAFEALGREEGRQECARELRSVLGPFEAAGVLGSVLVVLEDLAEDWSPSEGT